MLTSNQAQASFLQAPMAGAADLDLALPSAKSLRTIIVSVKLVTADVVGLALGYAGIALLTRVAGGPLGTKLLLVMAGMYLLVAFYGRSYAPGIATNGATSVYRALLALVVTFLSMVFGAAILDRLNAGWLQPFTATMVAMMLGVTTARIALAFALSARWWRSPATSRHTLVLVDGDHRALVGSVDGMIVDVAAHGLRADVNDPTALARLGKLVGNADRVVVACAADRRASWSAALGGANVPVELLVEEIGGLVPLGAGTFGTCATLQVAAESLSPEERLLKRLFDIAVAAAALVFLLPFFLVVALAIKLDSPGPVFFRQPRVGRSNRPFRMHKFRSMRSDMHDLNANRLTTGRDDDRVTRVGRFIRATSIDELPQVIDVLLGHMSIVGPRPHALGAKAGGKLYWEVDGDYWRRHSVKPGITGLAQVRGFRGTTFEEDDLRNRLASDLEYVENWSFTGDLWIVLRTFMALTGQRAF
jgi:lipopolysaccharide/colanic/teichoic acid biosynthesis glycosyltransferase